MKLFQILSLTTLSAVFLPAEAHSSVFDVWGSFKVESSAMVTPQFTDTVKIERAAAGLTPGDPVIWVAEKTTVASSDSGQTSVVHWADSRSCPALVPSFAGLSKLEPVSVLPPGTEERDGVVYDGGAFELEARGHWAAERMEGSVVLRGGPGTPLSTWIVDELKTLAPCWKDEAPPEVKPRS